MNTEHTFQVPDLSCGHCVASVTKALAPLGAQVQADPATKQVRVSAPATVARTELVAALVAAGYPPA
ncbi:MAG: heavy-metal-associated domain-containing protein [Inhella sp.]|jgi:copper chaperone|uniref:heavy-metal-associated domain-containing protein n=1 Tax=Inhella sp. TaxID=1921806 RepID=UPI0022C6A9DF|nr:heavy-metal-associated domain-containing protein [Inhella sp.]MCZ8236207.1 heavy-metal-associated domain-containing protein [Inhella sp.]